jgi:hypothetical protein
MEVSYSEFRYSTIREVKNGRKMKYPYILPAILTP